MITATSLDTGSLFSVKNSGCPGFWLTDTLRVLCYRFAEFDETSLKASSQRPLPSLWKIVASVSYFHITDFSSNIDIIFPDIWHDSSPQHRIVPFGPNSPELLSPRSWDGYNTTQVVSNHGFPSISLLVFITDYVISCFSNFYACIDFTFSNFP